jgi:hypothetical protein
MPIMFIIKAQPGGFIDSTERIYYPDGHVYHFQKNAWMDSNGWKVYLDDLIRLLFYLSKSIYLFMYLFIL